ncbi:hypothetical protein BST97_01580 [Nonlabens spongiae]|uniref:ABC transporter domain-containing protein n=1 Tax=Nonlabens spongiae TaxID=331648 RepID=A0A1W6MH14_9FLAO|nr:ATP-binding cassette domain-containing protein [Nonlabens spongiae]ARN76796.1 hypothetical protein BST97_01580 [Nonlabens spongiae]
MLLKFSNLKPTYISEIQVRDSEIYLAPEITIDQGKIYLVEAYSGKGKSSLLDIIYGVHELYEGTLEYGVMEHSRFRESEISYVFQNLKLFPELTALENVQLKNELTDHKSLSEIQAYFKLLGLEGKLNQKVATLSLGQRQRVAIIRSLCMPFKLLLLDEPFSHLDEVNIEIISELLREEIERRNASIILTSLGSIKGLEADVTYRL